MKILIDLQSCQSGSRYGGIGRYSLELAKSMIRTGSDHTFLILLNSRLPAENEIRHELRGLVSQDRIFSFDIPDNVAEHHGMIAQTKVAELIREQFIADLNPDVVHITSLIEGLGDDVVTSLGEIFPASRTVVTLYDLIPLVEKEAYLTNHILENHYLRKIDQLRIAGGLLAISKYSADEGVVVGKLDKNRVINISSAVGPQFRPLHLTEDQAENVRGKFGINNKFLLFAGSFDIRKNHVRLIEAFSKLPVSVRSDLQLVIVGNGTNQIYEHLRLCSVNFGLSGEEIIFAGRVKDEDLVKLYNLCELFVFPSLREGFGLPVLEAMSCGAPTIGSNLTSVPEVLGLNEAMFDPYSVSSIAERIEHVLKDRQFQTYLRQHALTHSKNFGWDISAKKALDFIESEIGSLSAEANNDTWLISREKYPTKQFIEKFKSIAGTQELAPSFLVQAAESLANNEALLNAPLHFNIAPPKVGLISTWNARCGIASYSQYLFKSIDWPVSVFAPYSTDITSGDEPYVVRCWQQNSTDIRNLQRAIDEANIDIVSIQFNYGFYDFSALAKLIDSQISAGRTVTVTLHSTVDPPSHILPRRLDSIATSLRACALVMVHTLKDIKNLANIGVVENVILFPQGVHRVLVDEQAKNSQQETFTIATYGFFLPHKGLKEIIYAVKQLKSAGFKVTLNMINAEYPADVSRELINECRSLVLELGLEDSVRILTEYMHDQESQKWLSEAQLVVFPYQETGESSSAAVRMGIGSGALVVVTPLAIFDDVKDVVETLPGTSPDEIAKGIKHILQQFASCDGKIHTLKRNAHLWVESHDYSHLAKFYMQLVLQSIISGDKCPNELI